MVDCNRFQETPLSRAFRRVFRRKLSLTALALGTPGLAMAAGVVSPTALPQGYSTVYGNLSYNPDGSTLKILQRTGKAIANFDSFNIGEQAHVVITQPGRLSAFLGRVVGTNQYSQILGSLQANGRVFLVNPYGITFGQNANVDVGALVATTLDISDQDFESGNLIFQRSADSPDGASVINQGTIQTADSGGFVVLAGDYAQNTGLIEAQAGQVVLASGSQVTMTLDMGGLVSFAVNEKTLSSLAGVDNAGQILADGGRVIMTAKVAGDLAATAVNNEGQVQADGISTSGGQIYLTAEGGQGVENTGTLSADTVDGNSGSVQITADTNIENAGTISASGAPGGVNAGGSVKLVADGTLTLKKGSQVSVDGGVDGGNGGYLELSGKTINTRGGYSGAARAAGYANGSLVMDPSNIYIVAGTAATSTIANSTSTPGSAAATVYLSKALNGFAKVTLNASNNIDVGRGPGYRDGIKATLLPGNKLFLNAGNDINVNNNIGASGSPYRGKLSFNAGNSININANIYTTNNVQLHADTDHAGGGNVNIMGSSASYGGGGGNPTDVTLTANYLVITGANVNIEGGLKNSHSFVEAGAASASHTVTTSGSVTVNAAADMTISAESNIRIRAGHVLAQASGSGAYTAIAAANANVSVGGNMILVAGAGGKVALGGGGGTADAAGGSASAKTLAVAQADTNITVHGDLKIYHSMNVNSASGVGSAGIFGGKFLSAAAFGSGSNQAVTMARTTVNVSGGLTMLAHDKVAVVGFGRSAASPANIAAEANGNSASADARATVRSFANVAVTGNVEVFGSSSYGGNVVSPTGLFGVAGQIFGSNKASAGGSDSHDGLGQGHAVTNVQASLVVGGNIDIAAAGSGVRVAGQLSGFPGEVNARTHGNSSGASNTATVTQSAKLQAGGSHLIINGGQNFQSSSQVNAGTKLLVLGGVNDNAEAIGSGAGSAVVNGSAVIAAPKGNVNVNLSGKMVVAGDYQTNFASASGQSTGATMTAKTNVTAGLTVGKNLNVAGTVKYGALTHSTGGAGSVIFAGGSSSDGSADQTALANGSGSDLASVKSGVNVVVSGIAAINAANEMAVVGGFNSPEAGYARASGTLAKHPGVHNASLSETASVDIGQFLVVRGGIGYGGTIDGVGSMKIVGANRGWASAGAFSPLSPSSYEHHFGANKAAVTASANVTVGRTAILSVTGDLNVMGAGTQGIAAPASRDALALGTASTGNNSANLSMSAALNVSGNLVINGGISGTTAPANSAGYVKSAGSIDIIGNRFEPTEHFLPAGAAFAGSYGINKATMSATAAVTAGGNVVVSAAGVSVAGASASGLSSYGYAYGAGGSANARNTASLLETGTFSAGGAMQLYGAVNAAGTSITAMEQLSVFGAPRYFAATAGGLGSESAQAVASATVTAGTTLNVAAGAAAIMAHGYNSDPIMANAGGWGRYSSTGIGSTGAHHRASASATATLAAGAGSTDSLSITGARSAGVIQGAEFVTVTGAGHGAVAEAFGDSTGAAAVNVAATLSAGGNVHLAAGGVDIYGNHNDSAVAFAYGASSGMVSNTASVNETTTLSAGGNLLINGGTNGANVTGGGGLDAGNTGYTPVYAGGYGSASAGVNVATSIKAGGSIHISEGLGVTIHGHYDNMYADASNAYLAPSAAAHARVNNSVTITAGGAFTLDGGHGGTGATRYTDAVLGVDIANQGEVVADAWGSGSHSAQAAASATISANGRVSLAVGGLNVTNRYGNVEASIGAYSGAPRGNGASASETASLDAQGHILLITGGSYGGKFSAGELPINIQGLASAYHISANAWGTGSNRANTNVSASVTGGLIRIISNGALKVQGAWGPQVHVSANGHSSNAVATATANATATLKAAGNLIITGASSQYGGFGALSGFSEIGGMGGWVYAEGYGVNTGTARTAATVSAGGAAHIAAMEFNVVGNSDSRFRVYAYAGSSSVVNTAVATAAATLTAAGGNLTLDGGSSRTGSTGPFHVIGAPSVNVKAGTESIDAYVDAYSFGGHNTATVSAGAKLSASGDIHISAMDVHMYGAQGEANAQAYYTDFNSSSSWAVNTGAVTKATAVSALTITAGGAFTVDNGHYGSISTNPADTISIGNYGAGYAEGEGWASVTATGKVSTTLDASGSIHLAGNNVFLGNQYGADAYGYGYSSGANVTVTGKAVVAVDTHGHALTIDAGSNPGIGQIEIDGAGSHGGVYAYAEYSGSVSALAVARTTISAGKTRISGQSIYITGGAYGAAQANGDSSGGLMTATAIGSASIAVAGDLVLNNGFSHYGGQIAASNVQIQGVASPYETYTHYLGARADGYGVNSATETAAVTVNATGKVLIAASNSLTVAGNNQYVPVGAFALSAFSSAVLTAAASATATLHAGTSLTVDAGETKAAVLGSAVFDVVGANGQGVQALAGGSTCCSYSYMYHAAGQRTATANAGASITAGGNIHLSVGMTNLGNESGVTASAFGSTSATRAHATATASMLISAGGAVTLDGGYYGAGSHLTVMAAPEVNIGQAGSPFAYAVHNGSVAGLTAVATENASIEASGDIHLSVGTHLGVGNNGAQAYASGNSAGYVGGLDPVATASALTVIDPNGHDIVIDGGSYGGVHSDVSVGVSIRGGKYVDASAMGSGSNHATATGRTTITGNMIQIATGSLQASGGKYVAATAANYDSSVVGAVNVAKAAGSLSISAASLFSVNGGSTTLGNKQNGAESFGLKGVTGGGSLKATADYYGFNSASAAATAKITGSTVVLRVSGAVNIFGKNAGDSASASAGAESSGAVSRATTTGTAILSAAKKLVVSGSNSSGMRSPAQTFDVVGGGSNNNKASAWTYSGNASASFKNVAMVSAGTVLAVSARNMLVAGSTSMGENYDTTEANAKAYDKGGQAAASGVNLGQLKAAGIYLNAGASHYGGVFVADELRVVGANYGRDSVQADAGSYYASGSDVATLTTQGAIVTTGALHISAANVEVVGADAWGWASAEGYSGSGRGHGTAQYTAKGIVSASGALTIDGGVTSHGAVSSASSVYVAGADSSMGAEAHRGGVMNASARGVARITSGANMHVATQALKVIGMGDELHVGAYGSGSSARATALGSGSASLAAAGTLVIDGGTSATYGGHGALSYLDVVANSGAEDLAFAYDNNGPAGRNTARAYSTATVKSGGSMTLRVSDHMLVAGNMATSESWGAYAEAYGDSSMTTNVATVASAASVTAGGALTVAGAKTITGAGASSSAVNNLNVFGVLNHAFASASDEGSNVAQVINTAAMSGKSVTLSVQNRLVVAGDATSANLPYYPSDRVYDTGGGAVGVGAAAHADSTGSNGATALATASISAAGSLEVDGGRPSAGVVNAVGSILVYGTRGRTQAFAGEVSPYCCGTGSGNAKAIAKATATLKSGTGMTLRVANRLAVVGASGVSSGTIEFPAPHFGMVAAYAAGSFQDAKNVALSVSNATVSAGGDLTVSGAVVSGSTTNPVNSIEIIGGAGEYGFAWGSGSNNAKAQAIVTVSAGGNMDLRAGTLAVNGNVQPDSGSETYGGGYSFYSFSPNGAVAGGSGNSVNAVNIGKVVSQAIVQANGNLQLRGGLTAGVNEGMSHVEVIGAGWKTTAFAGGYYSSHFLSYDYGYSHNVGTDSGTNAQGFNRGLVSESAVLSVGGSLTLEGSNDASLKVRGNDWSSYVLAGGTSSHANSRAQSQTTALVSVGGNLTVFGSGAPAAAIHDVSVMGVYSSQYAAASNFGGLGIDKAVGIATATVQVKGNIGIRTNYLEVRGGKVAYSSGSSRDAYARGSSDGAALQAYVSAAGLMSASGNITVKGAGSAGASEIAVYGDNGQLYASAQGSGGLGRAAAYALASGTLKSGKDMVLKVDGDGLLVFGDGYAATNSDASSIEAIAHAGGGNYKSVAGAVAKATGTVTVGGTLTVRGGAAPSAAVSVYGSTGGTVAAHADGMGITNARASAIGLVQAANASVTVGATNTLNVMGGDNVYAEASATQDVHHPKHGAADSAIAVGNGSLVVSGALTLAGTGTVTVTGGTASAGVDDGIGTIVYGTESAQAHADANLLWSTISKPAGLTVTKTDGATNSFGTPSTAISVSAVGDPPPIPAPGSITSGAAGLQPTVGAPVIQLGPNAIDLGSQVPGAYLLLDGAASTLNLGVDSGPVQFLPPGVEQDLQALNAAGLFGMYPGAALAIDLGDNNIVIVSEDGELYFGPGTLAGSSQVRTLEQVAEVTSKKK